MFPHHAILIFSPTYSEYCSAFPGNLGTMGADITAGDTLFHNFIHSTFGGAHCAEKKMFAPKTHFCTQVDFAVLMVGSKQK